MAVRVRGCEEGLKARVLGKYVMCFWGAVGQLPKLNTKRFFPISVGKNRKH